MAKYQEYSNGIEPTWCKGCGDFSVLRSLQIALSDLEIPNKNLSVVSGIGCSGRISGYMKSYSFHGIHGRVLPVAQGIKAANPKLTVIATGGDGDGFAIGSGHFIHAAKRDMDITYIVMDNQIYGLTKGHTSPISEKGFKTSSTPYGKEDTALEPALLALSGGASFVAQGFSGYQEELVDIIKEGIQHKGFSFIHIYSPCITFNKINTYQWYRQHLIPLKDKNKKHDKSSLKEAMELVVDKEGMLTGLIYQNQRKSETDAPSLVDQTRALSKEEFDDLFQRLYI